MAEEIEYKYLVDKDIWADVKKPPPELIVQGFLYKSKDLTVRVRIKSNKGFLTIKGATKGISRSEFEYEIPLQDAESLIQQFTDKHITKHRYRIDYKGKTWEVDEFHGKLEGLILAELEVNSEHEKFEMPEWAKEDVSRNPNYFNSVLIDKC